MVGAELHTTEYWLENREPIQSEVGEISIMVRRPMVANPHYKHAEGAGGNLSVDPGGGRSGRRGSDPAGFGGYARLRGPPGGWYAME